MKKIFIILLLTLFPLISYSMENGNNDGKEELITIVIKKKDLEKVKTITDVCRVFNNNTDVTLMEDKHNTTTNVFSDEKNKKKWLAELKVSVGIGGTYGLINNEFDVGPTISVGYEFTF